MIHLAWLSRKRGCATSPAGGANSPNEREETNIPGPVPPGWRADADFLGDVVTTAFDLGSMLSVLIGDITAMPDALAGLFRLAIDPGTDGKRTVEVMEFFDKRFRRDP